MKTWIAILLLLSFSFWFLVFKIWSSSKPIDITREQDSFVFPTPKVVTTDPFATQSSGF